MQSPLVRQVFVVPGNAGTALEAENVDIAPTDFARLIKFAKQNQIHLTVVGPELPLVQGIVDAFIAEKLKIFGPSKAAAELEGSKGFCKGILRQADVPTADYHTFRDADSAVTFLKDREEWAIVVKADGLAAGKGVFVCQGAHRGDRRGRIASPGTRNLALGGQPSGDRRSARWRRGQCPGDHGRPDDCHLAGRARSQVLLSMVIPVPTPAAWSVHPYTADHAREIGARSRNASSCRPSTR